MLEFRELKINFDPTKGQKQNEGDTVVFGGRVRRADALLKGFHIAYTDKDHHVWKQEIDLDASLNGNSVNVNVNFLLRDKSGNIDDRYEGWVRCVVIADVA